MCRTAMRLDLFLDHVEVLHRLSDSIQIVLSLAQAQSPKQAACRGSWTSSFVSASIRESQMTVDVLVAMDKYLERFCRVDRRNAR